MTTGRINQVAIFNEKTYKININNIIYFYFTHFFTNLIRKIKCSNFFSIMIKNLYNMADTTYIRKSNFIIKITY